LFDETPFGTSPLPLERGKSPQFYRNPTSNFTHYLNMKQLIGLIRLGALTAASVVPHPETLATKTLDGRLPREGELVLLGIDGTVVAREINLAPHAGYSPCLFGAKTPHLHIVACD
jgi:hypothetical protein